MAKKKVSKTTSQKTLASSKDKSTSGSEIAVQCTSILAELESMSNSKMQEMNLKNGLRDPQFGVKMGDIRTVAKKIKPNHELAMALWKTKNIDAKFLATLLINASNLTATEMDRMVRSVTFVPLGDWLHSNVTKEHPDKESLRLQWMTCDDIMAARAGWRLTAGRVVKNPDGLDLTGLLDRIESEMGTAAPQVQWTMNTCLAEIGINFPKHRKRAIAIGEKLGVLRDYPTSKGCTSPFAPIWIAEMVKRNGG